MTRKELAIAAKGLHKKHFGQDPEVMTFAPGRAEVLGNHTDYNEGTVLSVAIDKGHCFCISSNENKGLRLMAGDLEQIVNFTLDHVGPVQEAGWASYVKGVFFLLKEKGLQIENWDCTFLGSIPIGSGLSSSAALEVSAAYGAQEMTGKWIDKIETAKICQQSEQQFAGCNCGLLDQFSSIFGEEHCLIHSDFRSLEVKSISIPQDIQFLIITPDVTHSLVNSPYNERREMCELAVSELKDLSKKQISALRDVSPEELFLHKEKMTETALKRASHVVGEIDRVAKGVEALSMGFVDAFGELMYISHESSRLDFENSSPELDAVVAAAKKSGVPGARLSGGGWGGSLIAIIHEGEAEKFSRAIAKACDEIPLKFNVVLPSSGAEVLMTKNKE